MIAIITGNNEIEIEGVMYHFSNSPTQLTKLISDLLDKAYYSGERLRLYEEFYDPEKKVMMKMYINEW